MGIAIALRADLKALDRHTAGLLAGATLPAAVAGLWAHQRMERQFVDPRTTAGLLAGAGALMWLADRRPSSRPVGRREAAAAALAQVVALTPGVSRAGATVTALRALGVEREQALRFSMLMSLPVTAGAAGLTLLRSRPLPQGVAIGAPTAALVGGLTAGLLRGRSRSLLSGATLYRLGTAAAVAVRLRNDHQELQ